MPMQLSAPAIPTIGQAELVATIAIVTLKCPCKTIVMGQMGVPLICTSCKRVWFVSAKSQIQIQEVLGDLTQKESSLLYNG